MSGGELRWIKDFWKKKILSTFIEIDEIWMVGIVSITFHLENTNAQGHKRPHSSFNLI